VQEFVRQVRPEPAFLISSSIDMMSKCSRESFWRGGDFSVIRLQLEFCVGLPTPFHRRTIETPGFERQRSLSFPSSGQFSSSFRVRGSKMSQFSPNTTS
jgi:hypothetical protein